MYLSFEKKNALFRNTIIFILHTEKKCEEKNVTFITRFIILDDHTRIKAVYILKTTNKEIEIE